MLKKREEENPEIPVAPMLDMAFNLLTFFILTFRPSPVELQFDLNLLPASAQAQPANESSAPSEASDAPAPISALITTLNAETGGGALRSIQLEENEYATLDEFDARLHSMLADPDLGFDQAEIRVDPDLEYQYLIEVINIFAKNKLTKISFTQAR